MFPFNDAGFAAFGPRLVWRENVSPAPRDLDRGLLPDPSLAMEPTETQRSNAVSRARADREARSLH